MKAKRTPRPARCPTLVALALAPEAGITERLAVESFRAGWCGTRQFDVLADCRNLLTLGAAHKDDPAVLAVCDIAAMALQNIRDRHSNTGRIGATGDEINALAAMVDVSEDFWKRQSGELFRLCNADLDRHAHLLRAAA